MSPRYTLPGGYINTDPYYISPEEEAAMYDGPPDWEGCSVPVCSWCEYPQTVE